MVRGLEEFKRHFAKYSDKYVLIGGTACALVMEEVGLEFRATKDLDIVLYIEALDSEFVGAFWKFINRGGYKNRQKSTGKDIFYRFYSPSDPRFPSMLELFSRKPDSMKLDHEGHLTPIPTSDAVSSLSAILLDDDYYQFIHEGKYKIEGLSVVEAGHLIPIKARAWIDLRNRKMDGENVKENDIRKHKNDIVRLYPLLSATSRITLPTAIKKDMRHFLDQIENEQSINLKNLGLRNISLTELLNRLRQIYNIPNEQINSKISLAQLIADRKKLGLSGAQLLEKVREFIAIGADVNDDSRNDHRPLNLAIKNYCTEISILLIENGADIHYRDRSQLDPIHTAINQGEYQIANRLIENGAHFSKTPDLQYRYENHYEFMRFHFDKQSNTTINAI